MINFLEQKLGRGMCLPDRLFLLCVSFTLTEASQHLY